MVLKKTKESIGLMFDEIAPKYDFLNHLFTANLDKKWRRHIVKYIKSSKIKSDVIIDLAAGTGDMIKVLLTLNPKKAYAIDISPKMLEILQNKIRHPELSVIIADSEDLPVESGTADIVTIGFGIRNFENLEASLTEILRVLKKGGMLIILEMFTFDKRKRFFEYYFTKIMPALGKIISGSKSAYSYLHSSVMNFRTVDEFIKIAEKEGYSVSYKKNNFLNFVYTVYLTK